MDAPGLGRHCLVKLTGILQFSQSDSSFHPAHAPAGIGYWNLKDVA